MILEDFTHHELHLVASDSMIRPYCPCGWIGLRVYEGSRASEAFKNHLKREGGSE